MVTKKLLLTLAVPVLMMASNAGCCGSSTPPSSTTTPTTYTTETTEETVQLTLEERIAKSINDEQGEMTNNDQVRVRDVSITDGVVKISMNSDSNLTESMTKSTIISHAMDVFGSSWNYDYEDGIFQLSDSIKEVEVQMYMELVDVKGNEIDSLELTVGFNRATYEEINWENFNFDNLPLVADTYIEGQYLAGID